MKNFLIFACIFLFGVSSFFRKLAVNRIHPYQVQIIALIVYVFQAPIWIHLLHKNKSLTNFNIEGITWGFTCIASYSIAAVLFSNLIKSSNDVGTLSVIVSMNPIITMFLSTVFLHEEITSRKIFATFLMLGGLILFGTKT